MDIKIFLMPVLSFIAGLVALFSDSKNPKTKKFVISILFIALASICVSEVYFKLQEEKKIISEKNKLNSDIRWGNERIRELSQALLSFKTATGENFEHLFSLLKKETEKITKEEPPSKNIVKKDVFGYAYYGIRSSDGTWSERYFKKLHDDPASLPEVGDKVEAISSVNAREGYISFKLSSGWTNKRVIGLIKPNDRLEIAEVKAILGSFIWIKFKRI